MSEIISVEGIPPGNQEPTGSLFLLPVTRACALPKKEDILQSQQEPPGEVMEPACRTDQVSVPLSPCSLVSSLISHPNHPLYSLQHIDLIPTPPISSTSSCLDSISAIIFSFIILFASPPSSLARSLFPSPPSSSAPSLCLHQPYFLQIHPLSAVFIGSIVLPPLTPSDPVIPLYSLPLRHL